MFTLRVIFVGLIAFLSNDSGPGMTAVLLNDGLAPDAQGKHEGYALLLEGRCEGGDETCTPSDQKLPTHGISGFIPSLQWRLSDETLELRGFKGATLAIAGGRPAGVLEAEMMPRWEDENRDVTWMPRLGPMVGSYKPYSSCYQGEPGDCPITARFVINAGELSTCHLAHDVVVRFGDLRESIVPRSAEQCQDLSRRSTMVGAERVRVYKMPDASTPSQAIADAVVIEQRIEASTLRLTARKFDSSDNRTADILPQDGALTLVVLNAPVYPKTGEEVVAFFEDVFGKVDSSELLKKLAERTAYGWFHKRTSHNHFPKFYGLFEGCTDATCTGFPNLDSARSIVPPGICEPYLECLESLLLWDRVKAMVDNPSLLVKPRVVHNLSRCDIPTYP